MNEMTAATRGTMRPNGRSPPFLAIGLFIALCVMAFNYWNLSSKNAEQAQEITILNGEKLSAVSGRSAAEKRIESFNMQVEKLQRDINAVSSLKESETARLAGEKRELEDKCDSEKRASITQLEQCKEQTQMLKEKVESFSCDEKACQSYMLSIREQTLREILEKAGIAPLLAMQQKGADLGQLENELTEEFQREIQRQQQLAQLQQNQVYQPMVQAGQQLPQGNQQAGNQQYQQAGNQMNQPGVNQLDQREGNQGDQQVGNQGYQQVGNQVDQQAGDQGGQQAVNQADQQAVNQPDQQAVNQPDQQAGNQGDQQAVNQADQQAVNQPDQQAGNQGDQQAGNQPGQQQEGEQHEQVNQIPQPHQDNDGDMHDTLERNLTSAEKDHSQQKQNLRTSTTTVKHNTQAATNSTTPFPPQHNNVKDEEAASPLDKKEDNELPKDDMNDEDDDDDDNPLEDGQEYEYADDDQGDYDDEDDEDDLKDMKDNFDDVDDEDEEIDNAQVEMKMGQV